MPRKTAKAQLPPELHTWDQAISASSRMGVVNILMRYLQDGTICGFCVRSLRNMATGDDTDVCIYPITSVGDILRHIEREAVLLDQFDHYEVLIHEAPRVPDDQGTGSKVHPKLATVVCEEAGEAFPRAS